MYKMKKKEWYSYREVLEITQKIKYADFWICMVGTICGFLLGMYMGVRL